MHFLNLSCPPLPYLVVGGMRVFRPGDTHERGFLKTVFDLIYVRSGQLNFRQNDTDVCLKEGQFFLIFPGVQYQGSRICPCTTELYWVHFYAGGTYSYSDYSRGNDEFHQASPKFYYAPRPFTLSLPQTGTIQSYNRSEFEECMESVNMVSFSNYTMKKDFPTVLQSSFELQCSFVHLLNLLCLNCDLSQDKWNIAKQVRDYFDVHYMDEISLEMLSQHFSYSTSHLIRTFHQTYGVSPKKYLMNLRIEKASHLLLNSDFTVQNIGENVGFRTASFFIRKFREATGMTPLQYRAAHSGESF